MRWAAGVVCSANADLRRWRFHISLDFQWPWMSTGYVKTWLKLKFNVMDHPEWRCFEGDIFQKATGPSIHVKSLGCRLLKTYSKIHSENLWGPTDGRNPAPADMVNIPLYICRVSYMLGGAWFLPSTVLNNWLVVSHSKLYNCSIHDLHDLHRTNGPQLERHDKYTSGALH